MWRKIEKTVDRAVSNIVYNIWGSVGLSTSYDEKNKEICLIAYDKSYRCDDKQEIVNKRFEFDLENMDEFKAKHDVIATIEKYLIESYT